MAAEMIAEWVVDYACHRRMTAAIHVFSYEEMKNIALQELIDGPSGISNVSVRFMLITIETIMKQDDVKEYEVALRLIDELHSAVGKHIPFKIYAKSITGLKILVLFEMLRAGDKSVLSKLNEYFPPNGYSHPLAPEKTMKTMSKAQYMFRNFFIPMITDKARQETYFATSMKEDFGPKFYTVLKKHIEDFTSRIENVLPQTAITKLLAQPDIVRNFLTDSSPLIKEFGELLLNKVALSEWDILQIAESIKSHSEKYRKSIGSEVTDDSILGSGFKPSPESTQEEGVDGISDLEEQSVQSENLHIACNKRTAVSSGPDEISHPKKSSGESSGTVSSNDLFTDSSGSKSSGNKNSAVSEPKEESHDKKGTVNSADHDIFSDSNSKKDPNSMKHSSEDVPRSKNSKTTKIYSVDDEMDTRSVVNVVQISNIREEKNADGVSSLQNNGESLGNIQPSIVGFTQVKAKSIIITADSSTKSISVKENEDTDTANSNDEIGDYDSSATEEYVLDDISESFELQSYISRAKVHKEDSIEQGVFQMYSGQGSGDRQSVQTLSNSTAHEPNQKAASSSDKNKTDQTREKRKALSKSDSPIAKKTCKSSDKDSSYRITASDPERMSSEDEILPPSPQKLAAKRTSTLSFTLRQGGMPSVATVPFDSQEAKDTLGRGGDLGYPDFNEASPASAQPNDASSARLHTPDSSQDDFFSLNQEDSVEGDRTQSSIAEFHTPTGSPGMKQGPLPSSRNSGDELFKTGSWKSVSENMPSLNVPCSFPIDKTDSESTPPQRLVKQSVRAVSKPRSPLAGMMPCTVKVYKSLLEYDYHDKICPIYK